MSDLVKRLRAGPYDQFDPRKDQELEAADLIEALGAALEQCKTLLDQNTIVMTAGTARIEALEADGHEATRLLDLWSEIPGAENFAPYQDTMAFLGKPNSVGWVWAREVREERDFDKEQARQRDLAMQCICEAEEHEQAALARIEALKAALQQSVDDWRERGRHIEALKAALRDIININHSTHYNIGKVARAALASEQSR